MRRSLKDLRGQRGSAPEHPVKHLAKNMREVFQDDESRVEYELRVEWPTRLYELGQGRSVAYTSNKWKVSPREFEDYKHVAESPNTTFVTDEFFRQGPGRGVPHRDTLPVVYPEFEYPPVVAELAPAVFFETRPIDSVGKGGKIKLSDHALQIAVPECIVYGCYGRPPGGSWSRKASLRPFLAIIHKRKGVLVVITGKRLDVKKDGIVG